MEYYTAAPVFPLGLCVACAAPPAPVTATATDTGVDTVVVGRRLHFQGSSFSGSGEINPTSLDIRDIRDATSRGILGQKAYPGSK